MGRERDLHMHSHQPPQSPSAYEMFGATLDHSRPAVLMIGADTELLSSRAAVIRKGGWQTTLANPVAVEALLATGSKFPVAIFCTTLSRDDNAGLASLFRRSSPETKLLLLLRSNYSHQPISLFDAAMEVLDGPDALIGTVRRLCS